MARGSHQPETRIGHDARAETTGTLDAALREGRLDLAEYERRLMIVQAARVRNDLTPAVAGLPVRSGQTGPELRISAADRERALVLLAAALTDGRIQAAAYGDAETLLHRAVTYADVDAVVGNLDAKASLTERDQAVARIETAVANGVLDPAEQRDRVAAVRRATTDAQLAALVADLPAGAGTARSPRASNADREAVAAQLHEAVEAGLLDLAEFDERVRAVYAARLRDELTRVVADLPQPDTQTPPPAPLSPLPPAPRSSLPPAPPVDIPPPRPPSFRAGVTAGVVAGIGMVLVVGIAIVLETMGLDILALVVVSLWVVVFVPLVVWAWRTTTAAIAAKRAPREVNRFYPVMQPVPPEAKPTPRVAKPTPPVVKPAPRGVKRAPKAQPAPRPKKAPRKRLLGRHKGGVVSLTCLVLPGGTPVAITGGRDNTARVWDLTDDSLRHTLSGHTHDVLSVAAIVLPDGVPVAVTLGGDRTARVWDLRDGSPRGTLPSLARDPQSVRCMALADGTPVAVACNVLETVQMWDLRDRKMLSTFTGDWFIDAMAPLVLPDGTPVALVAGMDSIQVVNLENGNVRSELRGHNGPVNAIDTTVLPDGTPVAVSVGSDKTVRFWDPQSRTLLHTIAGLTEERESVVCTSLPDGTPVAAACDLLEKTMMWDLRDGSRLPRTLGLSGQALAGVALPGRTLILGPADDSEATEVHSLT
jgi:hypothetical protein